MNKSRHLHTFVNPVISISFLWGKFTVFLSLDSCPHLVIRSFGLYYNRSSLRRDTSLYQLELMLKGFEERMLYLWHLTPVLVKMGIFFVTKTNQQIWRWNVVIVTAGSVEERRILLWLSWALQGNILIPSKRSSRISSSLKPWLITSWKRTLKMKRKWNR